jgi:hypothetical protein
MAVGLDHLEVLGRRVFLHNEEEADEAKKYLELITGGETIKDKQSCSLSSVIRLEYAVLAT